MNSSNHISFNVVQNAVSNIQQKVWEGVAIQNVKKMAPSSAHLEGNYIIDTFMNFSNKNKEKIRNLECQQDPKPAQIDPLSTGVMEASPKKQRSVSFNDSFNNTKKFTTHQSFLQRKALQTANSQVKSTKSNKQSFFKIQFEEKHEIYDSEEDRLRNMKFQKEKQEKEIKEMLIEKEKEALDRMVKNKKLLKDLKKYTYDYEGKFFGLGNIDPGKDKIMKILDKKGEMRLIQKQFKKPEQSSIENEKLKDRQSKLRRNNADKNGPVFNEDRPQSLIDGFGEDGKISQGIKLTTTKGNQSITKEKARPKLSGMKKYRRTQFKDITKDKKFIEHKYPGSMATIATPEQVIPINKNKIEKKKERIKTRSEKSLDLNNNNNKTIDGHNELPPLKDRSLKSSKMFSDRSMDGKIMPSRFYKKKPKINIDDEELYSINFSQMH